MFVVITMAGHMPMSVSAVIFHIKKMFCPAKTPVIRKKARNFLLSKKVFSYFLNCSASISIPFCFLLSVFRDGLSVGTLATLAWRGGFGLCLYTRHNRG